MVVECRRSQLPGKGAEGDVVDPWPLPGEDLSRQRGVADKDADQPAREWSEVVPRTFAVGIYTVSGLAIEFSCGRSVMES